MHCGDAQYGGIMKVTQLLIEAPMFDRRVLSRAGSDDDLGHASGCAIRLRRTAPVTNAARFGGLEPSEGQGWVHMKQESNVRWPACQCDVDACRQKVQRCQMGMGPKVRIVKRTWESEDRRFLVADALALSTGGNHHMFS